MTKDFTSQAGAFLQSEGKKTKNEIKATESTQAPAEYEIKPERKTKRIQVLIRPSLYERLAEAAGKHETSVNSYLNYLIAKGLDND